jgi:hypothetical protein
MQAQLLTTVAATDPAGDTTAPSAPWHEILETRAGRRVGFGSTGPLDPATIPRRGTWCARARTVRWVDHPDQLVAGLHQRRVVELGLLAAGEVAGQRTAGGHDEEGLGRPGTAPVAPLADTDLRHQPVRPAHDPPFTRTATTQQHGSTVLVLPVRYVQDTTGGFASVNTFRR